MILGTKRNPNWMEVCVVNAAKVRGGGGGGAEEGGGSLVSFNEKR